MTLNRQKGGRWKLFLPAAALFAVGTARAGDWPGWPVPWPPPGSTNPGPVEGPPAGSSVPPLPTTPGTPSGSGIPPTIDVPPPGGGGPPVGADSPPDVPVPTTPSGPSSPEPASAVMGLCAMGAGFMAWRRKRSS